MRINKEALKKVEVNCTDTSAYEFINVQTGEVESRHVTGVQWRISYKQNIIYLYTKGHPRTPGITRIETSIQCINVEKTTVRDLCVLFTVYKEILEREKNSFNHVDVDAIHCEYNKRQLIREEILKQESMYEKQLLKTELKRLAKENVDKRKPPVLGMIPAPLVILPDPVIERAEFNSTSAETKEILDTVLDTVKITRERK